MAKCKYKTLLMQDVHLGNCSVWTYKFDIYPLLEFCFSWVFGGINSDERDFCKGTSVLIQTSYQIEGKVRFENELGK